MTQIEKYQDQLRNLWNNSLTGPNYYLDLWRRTTTTLEILNRISYLREKDIVNDDFIEFFEYYFNTGETYYDWLEFMDYGGREELFKHFNKIKSTVKYSSDSVEESMSLTYYREKRETNPNYDPFSDSVNPEIPHY